MSRKITFLTLFLWLMTVTFPVIAQQKTDTTYTFRFVPQKDMFYVPWNGNDTELARLLECIENSKATIFDGKLPLLVDGYCNSLGGEAENLATAKIRANRVKSELITRAKIKEENFITHNHATGGDFVIVRLTVPAKETAAMDAEAEAEVIKKNKLLEVKEKFKQGEVPLPSFWGGFKVKFDTVEFWQGRENRLHDRFIYHLNNEGAWDKPQRLAP